MLGSLRLSVSLGYSAGLIHHTGHLLRPIFPVLHEKRAEDFGKNVCLLKLSYFHYTTLSSHNEKSRYSEVLKIVSSSDSGMNVRYKDVGNGLE